jgi:hypothetical protein
VRRPPLDQRHMLDEDGRSDRPPNRRSFGGGRVYHRDRPKAKGQPVTELLDDVWYSRELPVLREAVRGINAGLNGVPVRTIAEATGLNADDVVFSLRVLEAEGLVEMRWVMPRLPWPCMACIGRLPLRGRSRSTN